MASLIKQPGRRYAIQLRRIGGKRGQRHTIRLGKVTDRQARGIRTHVEHLSVALASRIAVPIETQAWVESIVGGSLHRKLTAIGLVKPRQTAKLDEYWERFIAGRSDLSQHTVLNLRQTQRVSTKGFGTDRELSTITRPDARDWQRKLLAKYAEATVAMHVKKMRQLYGDAIERGYVSDNPFLAVKAGSMVNADRLVYVTVADIERVIGACPNHEWRLLFALARFAGLRVPSEIHDLEWSDVDWERNRFTVRAHKTGRRAVPIFRNLYPWLLESQSLAEEGVKHVFVKLRGENLATTGQKIIKRAGLTPWPKMWQNLRSSCETDLSANFPLHVACAWIGNSTNVAMRHYLQVTEVHFQQAGGSAAQSGVGSREVSATLPEHVDAQTPVGQANQHDHYPQGSPNLQAVARQNLQEAHERLQAALHAANGRLEYGRRRMIRNLQAAVRAAKSKTTSGRRAP
jgi:integrase